MGQLEFDYYIPADVTIDTAGKPDSWDNIYSFDDRKDRFLQSFSGLGMPPIDYITQQGPYQNGVTALDFRLKPRTIQMVHRRLGNCRQDYWDNRTDLINLIRPNRQAANNFVSGRLRKILPNWEVRDLLCFVQSGPKFNARKSDEWDEYSFQETLRFVAHNPILFNPALTSVGWAAEEGGNLVFYDSPDWTDRLVFPIWFGGGVFSSLININYNGTWESFPIIYLSGPLKSPKITNTTTDKKIELQYDISAGETVTINLEYGQKTISNNYGINLIGTATTDSDMTEFSIVPAPIAANGINVLQGFASEIVVGQSEIQITFNERFIGI